MKLSMKWLSDYVNIDVTPKEYSDRMTDTGSKVEGFEILGENIKNVKVGKLISVERHPDSDHLWICMVDVGADEPVQIVTGAQNVKAGDIVPVALHDSYLPDGTHIKAGKLRGVASNGMLCSLSELGLTKNDFPYADEDGIFLLQEDCNVGDDIVSALDLSDTVVEFEITPNRPDCLSVIGLARETAASYDVPIKLDAPKVNEASDNDTIKNYLSVEVLDSDLCPRYTARVVKNIKIAPSPKWFRTRLRNCGIRPINNIVDITNYVCLEYGQPMHAFDYNYLSGNRIIVRHPKKDENIVTLDGVERKLKERMLVIADGEKAVAVAGVMGGENSEIKGSTKTIVFESAAFYGPSIRVTSRELALRTESSSRFEKGLDSENTYAAIQRACELVELFGAGEVVKGFIDVYGKKPEQKVIEFNPDKINAFLGTDIPTDFMLKTLKTLNIDYIDGKLYPPSFRADLECMQDIAEEVVRIYGYNAIKSTGFKGGVVVGRRNDKQQYFSDINNYLISKGFYEVQTYSFISPKAYDKINLPENDEKRKSIVISNPLGEDTSIMRTTALANILETLSTNRRYRNLSAAIYEMAKIYLPMGDGELADEKMTTVIAMYDFGDFYALKGIIEGLLNLSGISRYEVFSCKDNPTYHPGRCAVISKNGKVLSVFGQINPDVSDNFDYDLPVYAAEIDTEALYVLKDLKKQYKPLPKFPAVSRDLAFVCDIGIEAETLKTAIKKYAGSTLESVEVFDVYMDQKLGENKKSMAYSLVLRSQDKTLSDSDGDAVVSKVLKGLEKDYGVVLRS